MKNNRQEALLKIISEKELTKQVSLQAELARLGFSVTQATISRDIKSLNLVKVPASNGRYRYAVKPPDKSSDYPLKFRSVFRETVLKLDRAQNIVVVKCHVGMGNAACAAIDTMALEGVVGTLAGDDTAFILLRDNSQAAELQELLSDMLNTI